MSANPTPDAIRAHRESLGLTMVAAAALCGKAPDSWRHYESGRRKMLPATWAMFQKFKNKKAAQ